MNWDNASLKTALQRGIAQIGIDAMLLDVRVDADIGGGALSGSGEVSGAVHLVYDRAVSEAPKKLWMKTAADPEKAFAVLSRAYDCAVAAGIEDSMPRPIATDSRNSIVITEFSPGASLLVAAYRYCLRLVPSALRDIDGLFERLGAWLASYHLAARSGSDVSMSHLFDETDSTITRIPAMDGQQVAALRANLAACSTGRVTGRKFPAVYSHADFALRNVLIRQDGHFTVIDWDAPMERKFPEIGVCWWDLFHMWMNIQSLVRFWPLVSLARVQLLAESLASGYLERGEYDMTHEEFTQCVCYPLTLLFLAGSPTIRRADLRYSNLLSRRFINYLRRAVLDGNPDVAGWLRRGKMPTVT